MVIKKINGFVSALTAKKLQQGRKLLSTASSAG